MTSVDMKEENEYNDKYTAKIAAKLSSEIVVEDVEDEDDVKELNAEFFRDNLETSTRFRCNNRNSDVDPNNNDGGTEAKILYNSRTGLSIECSQTDHYVGRGYSLRYLSFLEYHLMVKCVENKKEKNEDKKKETKKQSSGSGRLCNGTFNFDSQHKLYRTHHQVLLSTFPFPILAGSYPPNLPGYFIFY